MGANYDVSADMWSVACIVFELLTGDLLFDPHTGKNWDRDEDHLAMMIELIGDFPKHLLNNDINNGGGKYVDNYFHKKTGQLKNILHLKFWTLKDVLIDKYHFNSKDAHEISEFLTPILQFDTKNRASALDCLKHKWLN